MAQHSHLTHRHIVDLAYILVHNQSLTTVSESTLWLSGKSFGLASGRLGYDSRPGVRDIFSYALLCYGYHAVRPVISTPLQTGSTLFA